MQSMNILLYREPQSSYIKLLDERISVILREETPRRKRSVEVSWPSIGAVSPTEARQFADALAIASVIASRLDWGMGVDAALEGFTVTDVYAQEEE